MVSINIILKYLKGLISQPYLQFKESVCEAVLPAIVELMAISIIIGFFNLINSIFGVCFVIRNKIDVPNSLPRRGSRSYSISSTSSEQGIERRKSSKSIKKQPRSDSMSAKKGDSSLLENWDSDEEEEEPEQSGQAFNSSSVSHKTSKTRNTSGYNAIN